MIRKEVKRQQELGIKSVTDGEFRRHMFWGAFASLSSLPPDLADVYPPPSADGFHNNLEGMTVVKNPGRELFKMYVPDVKAFFEVSSACC